MFGIRIKVRLSNNENSSTILIYGLISKNVIDNGHGYRLTWFDYNKAPIDHVDLLELYSGMGDELNYYYFINELLRTKIKKYKEYKIVSIDII